MTSGYQTPISIKDAVSNIVSNQYLLPAIQRKFVWSASTSMLGYYKNRKNKIYQEKVIPIK